MMAKSLKEISDRYFKRFPNFSMDISSFSLKKNYKTIIVIPCFKEEEIIKTLESLSSCTTPKHQTLVLILVNASENSSKDIHDFNFKTYNNINDYISKSDIENVDFRTSLRNNLPYKHAGVGYARKILMDTALSIFSSINHDGLIVNTDADCLFTKNYITELESAFENSKAKHGVIHFEHRIDTEKNNVLAKGIAEYELHLRYYKQALQWTNYPNVIHTIGSCMLCKASVYALEGGMNKRKAGEDFYFMNKLAKNHSFVEVKNASVLPSCRTSDRVPFGTGKAMNDYIEDKTEIFKTYDFKCFIYLKKFIEKVHLLYNQEFTFLENEISKLTFQFFMNINIEKNLIKIRKESKNIDAFEKKFFQWFDHLKALQFIHFYTENEFKKKDVDKAAIHFARETKIELENTDIKMLLDKFREIDKN